jgi:riboflavin synthase
MFTGIIEDVGAITKITKGRTQRIDIASELANNRGDSVAVQGICLTVADIHSHGFSVEAMKQTKRITTLPEWKTGTKVNLERALQLGGRIGGHIMLGHVDEIAKLIRIKGNEYYFQISPQNRKYLVSKGSIGIDGVSLTLSSVSDNIFSTNLIPYTLSHTSLGRLRTGEFVNVEFDYLAKITLGK